MKESEITLTASDLTGTVKVPTSKSFAHRAVIAASFAKGTSHIYDVTDSEDIRATISVMSTLGAKIKMEGTTVTVTGFPSFETSNTEVSCNESGSTIRFIIPILGLFDQSFKVMGKESLLARPMSIYENIYGDAMKVAKDHISFQGTTKAGTYEIPGNISSQFITGLLFALPLLDEDSDIKLTSNLESSDYINITIHVLKEFGIEIEETKDGYHIPGKQTYKAKDYRVEGDYSQAAFWLVASALHDGEISVAGLNELSLQGDQAILDILAKANALVAQTEDGYQVFTDTLQSATVSLKDCPDLGPIVALLFTQCEGKTELTDIERLRIKESDRVESTVETLKAFGANITSDEHSIYIEGPTSLVGAKVDSYNDHRIAMMSAVAASIASGETTILRANAVNKSYPEFFEDYKALKGA